MICGLLPAAALAHVGSPDIYADGQAGPYKLYVTVRPPLVIPGVAEIEVRSEGGVAGIQVAPIPMVGEASLHPPVADAMKQSAGDKQFFTGSLWIMASGSWQVRFTVKGDKGDGVLSIPVPATSSSTLGMQAGLGTILGGLGLLLVAGVVGIVGAAARDSQLPAGETAKPASRKKAWIAMGVTLALMLAAVWFGNVWWKGEADDYAHYVYKPLTMTAALSSENLLTLKIQDPGWLKSRKTNDFVLDHDHLMHLYLLRLPGYEVVYHLHPEQVAAGEFQLALPSVPAGDYQVYADVVHATGFPETLVARIQLPEITGRALAGDDAKGVAPALTPLPAGNACPVSPAAGPRFALPDGYTMVWDNAKTLPAKSAQVFEFSLLDVAGKPASDMALYMGMVGHAAFVKDDGTVFAHVHPSGTASMAALMMAAAQNRPDSKSNSSAQAMAAMPDEDSDDSGDKDTTKGKSGSTGATAKMESMAGMEMTGAKSNGLGIPSTVGFPYGFPTPGAYRIFVQMKHGQTIETAAFDGCAGEPSR
jgi:hypothetical protein